MYLAYALNSWNRPFRSKQYSRSNAQFAWRFIIKHWKIRVSGWDSAWVGLHIKTSKMHFWLNLLERSILSIDFLYIQSKLSSWTKDSLLNILLLDIAVSIVLHDKVGYPLDNYIDIFIGLSVIDSENCFEDWFNTCSLLKLKVKCSNLETEIVWSLSIIVHAICRKLWKKSF